MNTLREINPNEADQIQGGIDAFYLGAAVALFSFVVANWPSIKQGFADGVNDGYTATAH